MPNRPDFTSGARAAGGALPNARAVNVRSRPHPLNEIADLIVLQLSNWRWSWRSFVVLGTVLPLLYALLLGTVARHSGPAARGSAIIGAVVLAASIDTMGKTATHFVNLRLTGGLDHLLRLPVRPVLLILATGAAFCIFTLPGLLVTIFIAATVLHIGLSVSPMALLVVPIAIMAYIGIGALIGGFVATPELASPLSLLVSGVSLAAGPVVLPASELPRAVLLMGKINPASYIAATLRSVFLPTSSGHFLGDLVVVIAFATCGVTLAAVLVRRWAT
jgi:ABC-2 type transport system permease protein